MMMTEYEEWAADWGEDLEDYGCFFWEDETELYHEPPKNEFTSDYDSDEEMKDSKRNTSKALSVPSQFEMKYLLSRIARWS